MAPTTHAIPMRTASLPLTLGAALLLAPARADTRLFSQADRTIIIEAAGTTGGSAPLGRIVPLGDLNADGHRDFAWSVNLVIEPEGTRSGRAWIVSGATGAILRTIPGAAVIPIDQFGATSASPGDVNGDAIADLAVVGSRPPRVDMFNPANGALLWSHPLTTFATPLTLGLLAVADLNNDSLPDLAARDSATSVAVLSAANGAVIAPIPDARGLRPAGDLNADAVPDLLGPRISLPQTRFLSGATWQDFASLSVVDTPASIGDINGDTVPDLAALVPGTATLRIFSGATRTVLRSVPLPGVQILWSNLIEAAGDVDADGVPDIAIVILSPDLQFAGVAIISGRTCSILRTCITDDPLTQPSSTDLPASGADLNNDAVPDLLIRAYRFAKTPEGHDANIALLFYGAAPCPADANYDRAINFADLNLVLAQFGSTGRPPSGRDADVNHDTLVNFADLNIVLGAFGTACAN